MTASGSQLENPYGAEARPAPAWRHWLRPWVLRAEALTFPWVSRPLLRGRSQLPTLLNRRRLLGAGVEVGVWEAGFSDFLLTHWRGSKLISVDPWKHWDEGYADISNVGQEAMDRRYEKACGVLRKHGTRSEVWRTTGSDAASKVADNSLDFVYLDAMHHEAAVAEDLTTWYPKLRPGALFAGHDYLDGELPSGVFGVKSAVDKFAASRNLAVLVTRSEAWPTWYLFKAQS